MSIIDSSITQLKQLTETEQCAFSLLITTGRDGVDMLQQGLVAISSNADCRTDTIFGKFVSENSTCVTSAAGDKFTCVVSSN